MERPEYEPLAEIEVDAASPSHQGFTLMGQGLDHAEYQLDLRFEMPLDQRTRTVLGELLSHSDLTIPRRAPGGPPAAVQGLGTAACYAVGPVIAERKLAGADGLAVTAACLGLATVVYAPPAALTWPHTLPSAQVLAALAGLALVCTALAFVLYFKLISEVGAVR